VHRMPTATHPLSAHVPLGDTRTVLDRFVAFSRIAADEAALDLLASWLLPPLAAASPDAVIAPRTAGVALGWTLARRLGAPLHLASVDDRGRPDSLLGDPGLRGARVLVVNDVVTTGAGLRALTALVDAAGAATVAATWFLSRGEVDVAQHLQVPTAHVVTAELPSWPADKCSLCDQHEQLTLGLDLN
jgi:adenine/guanine phosphoribosyltransferase-like PRPP-binding protein